MQIVFGREAAEQLREKYTVLELETVPVQGETLETFCVVPMESIALEMAALQQYVQLHEKFVKAIKDNEPNVCVELSEHLMGKFGGELDSFYEIIADRCASTGSTEFMVPPEPSEAA
jgi:hypothetical protein